MPVLLSVQKRAMLIRIGRQVVIIKALEYTEVMLLVQICFKTTLKQNLFTLKEYKQLFSLPQSSRWRPKGDYEGQI